MKSELNDLAVLALATAFMWVPYILDSMRVRGIVATLSNPRADGPPLSAWAGRAKRAHYNAVENLVVFATLIIVAHEAGALTELTALVSSIYVWARIAHYVIYTAGVPVARTLSFLVGFACQVTVALQLVSS